MTPKQKPSSPHVIHEKSFQRFSLGQRWEHLLLFLSTTVLALTGLPQKYRDAAWSQDLLSTPERLDLVRQIHHIAAIVLALVVVYHIGNAIYLMSRRKLRGDILPTMQDLRDAGHMLQYLLFLRQDKPKFGKYNFEQKVTYWFLFFGLLIMGVTGFIIWFPVQATYILPGGAVPAAKLAHSTESVIAVIFIVIWHFYHVHFERLNLSIFTGRLSETEAKTYHTKEYERLTGQPGEK